MDLCFKEEDKDKELKSEDKDNGLVFQARGRGQGFDVKDKDLVPRRKREQRT